MKFSKVVFRPFAGQLKMTLMSLQIHSLSISNLKVWSVDLEIERLYNCPTTAMTHP